ncbi:hypothetical protein [Actinoplanes sp. DH11]|uniref:hypothetical protein n=1 Tax=Actinoplanes sp. DH11 TaxID=2857011 RepID=UPI001E564889|nr:hypothetical protein [Actinoplanes sp. DH11]
MRYATPTRSAHRAPAAGARTVLISSTLSLLVRPFPGAAGQHRTPVRSRPGLSFRPGLSSRAGLSFRRGLPSWAGLPWPAVLPWRAGLPSRRRGKRHLRREPYRTARLLSRGLAALIVAGICVMLGVLIVADKQGPNLPSASDQQAGPLTAAAVFPEQTSLFRASQARAETDCPVAVTGGLRQILQAYGCSHAIRAALTVPYAGHQITAGVLDLPDSGHATAVSGQVRDLVETGDGGFAALSGADTPPGTPVVWRTHGRYLLYCVIADPTGRLVRNDDPAVARIMTEVLDVHLAGTALPAQN